MDFETFASCRSLPRCYLLAGRIYRSEAIRSRVILIAAEFFRGKAK